MGSSQKVLRDMRGIRRTGKFRRFVAAKQNQRAGILRDPSDVMASTVRTDSTTLETAKDPPGCYMSTSRSGDSPAFVVDAPLGTKIDISQCKSPNSVAVFDSDLTLPHEGSTCTISLPLLEDQVLPQTRRSAPKDDVIEKEKKVFDFIRVESNSNPKGIIQYQSRTSDKKRQKKSLPWCDDGANAHKRLLKDKVVKKEKQVFDFIRVESNSNPKGIIQYHSRTSDKKRQKKSLTWWDDANNIHKPFLLKTDAIPMHWDEEPQLEDQFPTSFLTRWVCFA